MSEGEPEHRVDPRAPLHDAGPRRFVGQTQELERVVQGRTDQVPAALPARHQRRPVGGQQRGQLVTGHRQDGRFGVLILRRALRWRGRVRGAWLERCGRVAHPMVPLPRNLPRNLPRIRTGIVPKRPHRHPPDDHQDHGLENPTSARCVGLANGWNHALERTIWGGAAQWQPKVPSRCSTRAERPRRARIDPTVAPGVGGTPRRLAENAGWFVGRGAGGGGCRREGRRSRAVELARWTSSAG